MNILEKHPTDIANQYCPEDLFLLIQGIGPGQTISAEHTQKLDVVFEHWTFVALSREADNDYLFCLDDLICLTAMRLPFVGYEVKRIRWRLLRNLLEQKRLAIAAAESGKAFGLTNASRINDLLRVRPYTKEDLMRNLKMSPEMLNSVLGVMEEGMIITQKGCGPKTVVSLR